MKVGREEGEGLLNLDVWQFILPLRPGPFWKEALKTVTRQEKKKKKDNKKQANFYLLQLNNIVITPFLSLFAAWYEDHFLQNTFICRYFLLIFFIKLPKHIQAFFNYNFNILYFVNSAEKLLLNIVSRPSADWAPRDILSVTQYTFSSGKNWAFFF